MQTAKLSYLPALRALSRAPCVRTKVEAGPLRRGFRGTSVPPCAGVYGSPEWVAREGPHKRSMREAAARVLSGLFQTALRKRALGVCLLRSTIGKCRDLTSHKLALRRSQSTCSMVAEPNRPKPNEITRRCQFGGRTLLQLPSVSTAEGLSPSTDLPQAVAEISDGERTPSMRVRWLPKTMAAKLTGARSIAAHADRSRRCQVLHANRRLSA